MKKTAATSHYQRNDDRFPDLAAAVHKRALKFSGLGPYFLAETPVPLFNLWLEGFEDPVLRQAHNCHCCRRFLEQYGAIVAVNEFGEVGSALWDETTVPAEYEASVLALRHAVESAPLAGVHFDGAPVWGVSASDDKKRGIRWEHFSIPALWPFKHPLKSAFQAAAEVREERVMLARALADFPLELVQKAKALCESETLYRSEKVLGVATWLAALHGALEQVKNKRTRENILWYAAARAPAGFCHVRSTMIGTLLEDLADPGKTVEDAKRAFASKMHPLQYQRPTAGPTEAQIAEAEKVMERLRTARALERRFARLEDLELFWKPERKEEFKAGGLFGHLRPNKGGAFDTGGVSAMTWEKFARQVLPGAERIELNVPAHGPFLAFVTAAHPDAPPMLQWDSEERRNPVSWYVYHGGSYAERWGVRPGWRELTGITLLPPMWGGRNYPNEGRGVVLVIDGARDVNHEKSGGFFVESLKSEYHGIRRTLEAYMMQAPIEGKSEASACGLDLRAGARWHAQVRVKKAGVVSTYLLDRWD